jgi:hypothetical protein
MEENKEVPQAKEGEVAPEPEVKEERPEVNYQVELARKNAELARLRAEVDERKSPPKRDPADITTWTDQELKMLRNSTDASVAQYKEQADDVLLERKVRAIRAKESENQKREEYSSKVSELYPEANDPTSEFSAKMEKVMRDYDLHRTPAGRLAAAKIVASEGNASDAKAKKNEADRVARVKSQMVDGDRAKPIESSKAPDEKAKDLESKLLSGKENQQVAAVSQILKDRGMDRQNFFGKR